MMSGALRVHFLCILLLCQHFILATTMSLTNRPTVTPAPTPFPFRIRTITAFTCLTPDDFLQDDVPVSIATSTTTTTTFDNAEQKQKQTTKNRAQVKISQCVTLLRLAEESLVKEGYEVQTVRIATNSFTEYLLPDDDDNTNTDNDNGNDDDNLIEFQRKLDLIDSSLNEHQIEFFSLGPAIHPDQVLKYCPIIIKSSHRFSCSAQMRSGSDVVMARRAAECMQLISKMGDHINDAPSHVINGLGNFRFCATACCKPCIPFFPGAKGPSASVDKDNNKGNNEQNCVSFAIGLENGKLAQQLLSKAGSIQNISTIFSHGMAQALHPIQTLCDSLPQPKPTPTIPSPTTPPLPPPTYRFLGIDTSLNPSLDPQTGSIASALETIDTLSTFGRRGTLAVAAEITRALQSLPNVRSVGYSGLMLPVCEDRRLAALVRDGGLTTVHLLGVSAVCGVGLDVVPLKGDVGVEDLMGLVLDVAGLAFRWDKQLSCRLLICPGKEVGEETDFGSPYMCDCPVLSAE